MKKRKTEQQPFDCVAFKRQAQARIYEETRAMTSDEQAAYFRQRAQSGSLGAWWKRLSATSKPLAVHESTGRYSAKKKRR